MKLLSVLKTMLLPNTFVRSKCEDFRKAFAIVGVVFLIAYIALVASVAGSSSGFVEKIKSFAKKADDFYLKDRVFHYDGDGFSETLDCIGIRITLDGSENGYETDPDAFLELYLGRSKAEVSSSSLSLSYSLTYGELEALIGDSADFTKAQVLEVLDEAGVIVSNTVISLSVFVFFLLFAVLLLIMLVIGLIIKGVSLFLDTGLTTKNVVFITLSSFLYVFALTGAVLMVPGGFAALLKNALMLIRLSLLIILVYSVMVLIPVLDERHKQ